MKRKLLLTCLAFCLLGVFGRADDAFYYRTVFSCHDNPGPAATDSDGGLYYATFDGADSRLFYVPDPIFGSDISNHIEICADSFSSGRGYQGLAVFGDSVYVSGDQGTGCVLKKYDKSPGSPPTFSLNAAFSPGLAGENYSGVAVTGDSGTTVAVTTKTGCVDLLKASDGSLLTVFCGCRNYQRDLVADNAFNLYAGRNGQSSGESVNKYAFNGGLSYTVQNDFITTGAVDTSTGEGLQGVGYSENLDRLFVARRTPGPYLPGWNEAESVMIYDPASSTTIVQEIYGGPGGVEAGDIQDVGDMAAAYDGAQADVLYVTDTSQDVIYVFQNDILSKVKDWRLFER